ncbi:hypothetical protein [Streptomyces sp. BE20]|uniref:hypothetical protein n=1 Tax=Streptomyces sp. BE20 TaxID=3002525 RepID=UPI002E7A923D|nr:hypothetical protein [Streptomyces sp. BE20]
MTVHRILLPCTLAVLGAVALTGCSGGRPAGGTTAAATAPHSAVTPNATATAGAVDAPAAVPAPPAASAPPAPPASAAAPAASAVPAVSAVSAAPAGAGGGGAGAQGGAPLPSPSTPGKTAPAVPRPAPPAARPATPAAVPDRVPSCKPGQLAVTAKPVSRPAGRLLLTARNTGTAPCDLGLVGVVTFAGGIKAAVPGGIGGGPNVLMPGQAGYEAVTLVGEGAPGSGATSTALTVALDDGATVTVRTTSFVHAPSSGLWRSTEAEALRQ